MNKMNSPLSPTLAASTAKLRNKVPQQLQRILPLYLLCVVLVLVVFNFDVLVEVPNPLDFFRDGSIPRTHHLTGGSFPQKIWQTWKVNPYAFEEKDAVNARSWAYLNPYMRYEVLTDTNEMAWVFEHYGPHGLNRMDIIHFYRSVNLPIIKADMLRYMIMYAEGGVYADIDVEAIRPLNRFIPERYDEEDIDIIVGVEIDQPEFRDHPILGKKSQSFCQWTFVSRPRQPVMLRLIEGIMAWLKGVAKEQRVSVADVQLTFDQVISGTGPSAFTIALLEEMNRRSSKRITWDTFHAMDESKIVSRILVLDVEAFCAGQGHSDSGNHDARGALVKHHYHASNWPSRHPRYSHPAYGQVEDCNWSLECVRKWDENVIRYEELTDAEKTAENEEMQRLRDEAR